MAADLKLTAEADVSKFLATLKTGSEAVAKLYKEFDGKAVKISANTADLAKAGNAMRQLVKDAQAAAAKTDIPITVRAEGMKQVQAELAAMAQTQRDSLVALQASGQSGSQEYKSLLDSIKATHAELTAFEDAAKAVEEAVNPAPVKSALEQISESFDKEQAALKGALDQNLKATAKLAADGKKGSAEWDKHVAQLKAAKEAADKYDKALEEVGRQIQDQPKKPFSEVAMGAFAVTAVVDQAAQAVNSLAAPSKSLDYVTGQLRTLGTEAADMSESLKAAAIDMSKNLPFAASDIQGVMFDALASGVKGGEEGLKVFADTAAKLAVGGGSEISEATSLLAGQMNAYGASSEQAGKYADTFFNIVNFGVTSVKDLSSTLANVVPTAAAMGTSMENVGAALALMTQKGVPTAQSTTKLNQLLIELQKPGKTLEPILAAAGVSLESLKQDDLPDTLGRVKDAIDATGGAAIQFFSSSEAAAAFSVLAGDLGGFEQTLKDVAGTAGSAENAFAEMAKTTQVQTDIMRSKMDAFLIKVADFAGPKAQVVAGFAAELAPVATSIGALSTVAINAGKGIGSISTKLKEAGGWSGVFDKMKEGMKGFGESVGKTGKGIMSNLFSWKGAALGVAAGLVALMAGTEEGKAAMAEVQESIGNALGGLVSTIAPTITALVDAFKPLLDGVSSLLGDVLGTLMATVGDLLSRIFTTIGPVLEQLGKALVPVFEAFNSVLLPIIKTVSELIYGAFSEVGDAIGEITKVISPLFKEITKSLAPVFKTLTDTLVPIFKELAGTLGEVFKSVGTIFADIVATVAPIIGQLAAAFTPVIKIVVELQTLFFKTFIETFSAILQTVVPIISELATMLGTFIGGTLMQMAPLIIQLGTVVSDVLKTLASSISDVLKGLVTTVIPIVQALFKAVVPVLKTLFEAIMPVVSMVLGSVGTVLSTLFAALQPVLGAIQEVLGSLLTTLGGALTDLFAALTPVIGQLGGLFAQVFGIIGGVVQNLVSGLLPVFDVLADVIAVIIPLIGQLIGTLAEALGPVIATLAEVLGKVVGILADLAGRVLNALAPLLGTIATLFGQILGVVAQVAGQLLNALAPVLDEIIGVLGDLIFALGDTVAELLVALLPAIELAVGLVAKLVEWLGGGLQSALKSIMPVLATVAKVVATVLAKALLVAVKVISAILKVITSVVKAIGGWLVGAVKTAVSWIKGAFAKAVEIASGVLDFFKGIISGVVGFFSDLVHWVSDAVDWFLKFARDVPIVGQVIDAVSATIQSLIGWIKDAIGWLAELFGFGAEESGDAGTDTSGADYKAGYAAGVSDAKALKRPNPNPGGKTPAWVKGYMDGYNTQIKLEHANGRNLPPPDGNINTGGHGGDKPSDTKSDDPYQAELDRLEEERKARELTAKETIKDEEKLQETLLLLDEEFAKKREGVATDFSDGTATVLRDGKAVVLEISKEIQETATKDITNFGLEVVEATKAIDEFAWDVFTRLNEELTKRREIWFEQGKTLLELRTGVRLALDEGLINIDELKARIAALRLTVDVAVGPVLGGIEETMLRNALALIGDEYLDSAMFGEVQRDLAASLTDAEKQYEEDLKKVDALGARSAKERAEARAEIERLYRKRQGDALQKFADAAKKIEDEALAERIAEYEKYGEVVTGVLASITDAVTGETAEQMEAQRKAHEERVKQYGLEEAMLRKTLQAGQTTSTDFVRQIDEMSAALLEEGDAVEDFWDRFAKAGKAAIDGLAKSLDNLRNNTLSKIGEGISKSLEVAIAAIAGASGVTTDHVKAALSDAAKSSAAAFAQIGASALTAFGQIAVSSENFWADTGALLKNVASQALDALAPQILSAFVSLLGPLGIPAGLLALGVVKAAISSFGDGGLIPGGAQLALVNEKGKEEYVINGNAVQRYGVGFLDAVNEGRLAISNAGNIVREAGAQLDERDLSRLLDLSRLAERVDFASLAKPVNLEAIAERPAFIDAAPDWSALIAEAAEVEPLHDDPYARQTAEATVALVGDVRTGNEIQKTGNRAVASRLSNIETLLAAQNTRNSSLW